MARAGSKTHQCALTQMDAAHTHTCSTRGQCLRLPVIRSRVNDLAVQVGRVDHVVVDHD